MAALALTAACGAATGGGAATRAPSGTPRPPSSRPAATIAPTSSRPAASVSPKTFDAVLGDHFFDPQVIVIRVGATVTWHNSSGMHDVTARDGSFRSPTLGDSYSHTFGQPGRYAFFCSYHPEMYGEVVVEPAH